MILSKEIYLYTTRRRALMDWSGIKPVGTSISQYSTIFTQLPQSAHPGSNDSCQRELIKHIYGLLNSSAETQTIIAEMMATVGHQYRIDNIVLCRLDAAGHQVYHIWTATGEKLEKAIFQEWLTLLHECKKDWCYQFCQGGNLIKSSLKTSLPTTEKDQHPSCILSFPLVTKGNLCGYLILQTKEADRLFSQAEIDTLEIIAHQITLALKQNQLETRLAQIELENKRLQSHNQNKSDYLSHMSHELRTPLAGIMGFSKMLRDELYGPLNEKQKQYVNGIRVSGEHLLALVNDFLDISKIEANKEEIFLETVAVEDICLAAISIVQSKAKEQDLELILDIATNIDFCTVDQRRIKQILLNLLSNAIKFTETGSVTLQVKRCQKFITFCVIDTGIGLKEADQKKLFQPFQQIHNHLSRKHKGTGLGLALSRKLAQLHGGDLTLTSEYGKGSCFTLELPIQIHCLSEEK